MKIAIKGAIILLVACLVVMAVGCEEEENVIKIGVIGPMAYVQGEHHWYGATLAAEEINDAGGIVVGDESYEIKLVKVDSDELLNPGEADSAMERAITVDGVDFVVGGIRSEAVAAMQEVAMEYETIFLGCGASDVPLCTNVADDYERYKYWFRVTPPNSTYLGQIGFLLLGHVAHEVVAELGVPPKVAILAEKAVWGDAIVAAANANLPALGMEIVGVWRPDDTATDVRTELSAIEAAGANIIFTALSGPVGLPYAKQWGELQIPAASVGINVEAQADDFYEATSGYGDYEMTMNTYARGVKFTDKTLPFLNAFIEEMGEVPTYNADTYNAIYILKEATERAGTLDSDAVVTELEKTDYVGTAGRTTFDETHDLVWGPGYVTALGVQWQNGELKAVWPPADGSWYSVAYEGVVDYQLPPWMLD